MKYLLDANTYIQAQNEYYQMQVCPGYWDWLDYEFHAGSLASISLVYDELKSLSDELSGWVKEHKEQFLQISDDETQDMLIEIARYVAEIADLKPGSLENFLGSADPWLIAKAKVIGAVIVTQEIPAAESARRITVPNVCKQFGVDYLNTFQLLRQLQACFVLQSE